MIQNILFTSVLFIINRILLIPLLCMGLYICCLQMETGCQLVPKMFSVTFLSGFCPQTITLCGIFRNAVGLVKMYYLNCPTLGLAIYFHMTLGITTVYLLN